FEEAEMAHDEETQRRLLTSIVIGGGPTGVEMAGAIAELGRLMVSRDFRNIRPEFVRTLLVEAGPRLLPPFPQALADYAADRLRKLGVEVMTNRMVEDIEEDAV